MYLAIVWLMPWCGIIQNNAHEGIIFLYSKSIKEISSDAPSKDRFYTFENLKYSLVLLVMNLEEENYKTYHRLVQFSFNII